MTFSKKGMQYDWHINPGKKVVVFSNSLGTTLNMWDQDVEKLKEKFQILRFNYNAQKALSIVDLGDSVIDLMEELEIPSAIFCGISLGGLVGLWLALNRPDYFDKIIIANTSAKIGNEKKWQERIDLIEKEGLGIVSEQSPKRWFTNDFLQRNPQVISKLVSEFAAITASDYIALVRVLMGTNLWDSLNKIKKQMIIIAGEFDETTTVSEAKKMHELIKGSHLIILPTSHLSNIESGMFDHFIN